MGKGKVNRVSGSIRPSKKLGQNFLTDEYVIDEIIEGSGIGDDSLVIEIGPGMGALTERLAERAGRVVAVELDDRLIAPLKVKLFSYDNTEVIHGDILKVDLSGIIDENLKKYDLKDVRVVGNLPYYITTPIIMKLLEMRTPADSITIMMQKEVGDRLLAEPGKKQAGAITYAVHYFAEVYKIVDAGRECFYPSPKVDSVVLRLDIRDESPVIVNNEELFFRLIRAGFAQRRKTLLNSLSSIEGMDKAVIEKCLGEAGIEKNRRAESLNLREFADLAEILEEVNKY